MICNTKRKYCCFILLNLFIVLIVLELTSLNTYGTVLFSDLNKQDYYYTSVMEMYDSKQIKGYPDGTFRPKTNVTVAEALTLIFNIANVDYSKSTNAEFWYSDVVTKAKRLKIISNNIDPNSLASRLDIGKYIIAVYKLDTSDTYVHNVFEDTNLIVANTMYQYGVFQGVNTPTGLSYKPNNSIIRGDLCLVLNRLTTLLKSPYTTTQVVGRYTISPNPTSSAELEIVLKAIAESGSLSLTIPYYKDLSDTGYYLTVRNNAVATFESLFLKYPELFSFTPTFNLKRKISDTGEGSLTFYLHNVNIPDETVLRMKSEFISKSKNMVMDLRNNGSLTVGMLDVDKARVLFEYVAHTIQYDTLYGVNSYTGYGAAVDRLAVCQGYTALFNQLCKLTGIAAEGVGGRIISTQEDHMWSKIMLDGLWVYCDTTFSDPIPNKENFCDLTYFNMSYSNIMIDRVED